MVDNSTIAELLATSHCVSKESFNCNEEGISTKMTAQCSYQHVKLKKKCCQSNQWNKILDFHEITNLKLGEIMLLVC